MIRLIASICVAASVFATASAERIVLGKLGQTTESVGLHSSMSARSHVFYNAKPHEYLVVRPTKYDKWVQVLLSDGRVSYAPSEKVAVLPYQVTSDVMPGSRGLSSRGFSSRGGRGGPTGGGNAAAISQYALHYVGTPYKWGGDDLQNGIDCSGFVKELFGQIGVNLPRTAAEQATVGMPITRLEDLQPGDRLYFWDKKRGKIGHTGIYQGKGYFVHSSSGNGGVATDYLGKQKWLRILVAARR